MDEWLRPATTDVSCRLCGGDTRPAFSLQVLRKYDVQYSKCTRCESLQTERPYWMQEAYASNLSILDTGAAQRNITNLAVAYAASRVLRLRDVVDFGGGDGLLCRFLRDYGINCFVHDKYASATYAAGFDVPDFSRPEILLAFEVMEHFENPYTDLQALFQLEPSVILASTGIFARQSPDWWYLSPETGQHLFFYSEKALQFIASSFDYTLLICSGHFLFLRPGVGGALRRHLIRFAANRYALRLMTALMRLLPTQGVWNDFNLLRSKK
jgi:hypothetical protein